MRFSRGKVISAITGGLFGVVGVGVAATFLTTSITGSSAFANGVNVSDTIVSVVGTNGDGLDCTLVGVSGSGESVTFNPRLKRAVVQGTPQPYKGGTCEITAKLKNNGDVALKFVDGSISGAGAQGWKFEPLPPFPTSIAPGAEAVVKVKVTAPTSATPGQLTGQFRTTEA